MVECLQQQELSGQSGVTPSSSCHSDFTHHATRVLSSAAVSREDENSKLLKWAQTIKSISECKFLQILGLSQRAAN